MKVSFLVLLGLALTLMQPGCSVYKAASQPPPADLTGIGIGTPRGQLIVRLGAPKFSDTDPQGQKQDTFEFDSGFHSASKVRIIPYLAADLVTLGLAELILWPLEMTVMEKAKCVGMATYDPTQKVNAWNVSQKDGVQAC
jgi:hypothetical protein